MNKKTKFGFHPRSIIGALLCLCVAVGVTAAGTALVGNSTGSSTSSSDTAPAPAEPAATKTVSLTSQHSGPSVGAAGITDFTVSIGAGDLSETLPFNTSPIRTADGNLHVNATVTFTVTKPDASTVSYTQKTDTDGRIRGQLFNTVVDQIGNYTIAAQVTGGSSANATFAVRQKVLTAANDQTVTGRRFKFQNATNDTNAFTIADAAGSPLLVADTVNKFLQVADLKPVSPGGSFTPGSIETTVASFDSSYLDGNHWTTVGADGFSRLVFPVGAGQEDLHLVRCLDVDCVTKNTTTVVTGDTDYIDFPSIRLATDGTPRILYMDYAYSLHYIKCNDADCTTRTDTVVDTDASYDTNFVLDGSGLARIAHGRDSTSELVYFRCLDVTCATKTTQTIATEYPNENDIALGLDGFPRILYSHWDESPQQTRLVTCTDADCTSRTTQSVFTSTWRVYGEHVFVGSDGLVRVTVNHIPHTNDVSNRVTTAHVIRCTDATCTTRTDEAFDMPNYVYNNIASQLDSNDRIRMTYADGLGMHYVVCTDATCANRTNEVIDTTPDYPLAIALSSTNEVHLAATRSDELLHIRITTPDGADIPLGTAIGSSTSSFGGLFASDAKLGRLSVDGNAAIGGTLTVEGKIHGTDGIDVVDQNGDIAIKTGNRTGSYTTASTLELGRYLILDSGRPEGGNSLFFQTKIHGFEFRESRAAPYYPGSFSVRQYGGVQALTINQATGGNIGINGVGTPSSKVGIGGTGAANGLTLGDGAADSVNLYRTVTDGFTNLHTDKAFFADGGFALGTSTSPTSAYLGVWDGSGSTALQLGPATDYAAIKHNITSNEAVLEGSGTTDFRISNGELTFGAGDTNLYRDAAGVLKTDGIFTADTGLRVSDAASADQVWLGAWGANQAAISLGSDADYGALIFTAGTSTISVDNGINLGVSAGGKLLFGSSIGAYDVNLYRDAQDVLKTDDSLVVAGPYITFSTNVRGINIAIGSGATTVAVTFPTAHADANYAVQCTPTYNTTCFVTNKSTGGFTLNFGTAAPDADQKVDWFVVR